MNITLIEQIYRKYERDFKKKQVYELMFSLKKIYIYFAIFSCIIREIPFHL